MAVMLQTSVGELVVDLHTESSPFSAFNFLKLCKYKFFNNVAFHRIEKNFLAHCGAPATAEANWGFSALQKSLTNPPSTIKPEIAEENENSPGGGCSIWGVQTLLTEGRLPRLAAAFANTQKRQLAADLAQSQHHRDNSSGETGLESAAVKHESTAVKNESNLPKTHASAAVKEEPARQQQDSFFSGVAGAQPPTSTAAAAKSGLIHQYTSFYSDVDFNSVAFPPFPANSSIVTEKASLQPAVVPSSARFCPTESSDLSLNEQNKRQLQRHAAKGVVGWIPEACSGSLSARGESRMPMGGENSSMFYITLRENIDFLDKRKLTVFGHVFEGTETLEKLNQTFVDEKFVPLTPVRILHTYILDDPFQDPPLLLRSAAAAVIADDLESPLPVVEEVGSDEEALQDEVLVLEKIEKKEAEARKVTLEILGDLPAAEAKPPENVLFVAQLNPVTEDEDLRIVFSRFGEILSCDVIRDWKTGQSLQYAFITFAEKSACELAYFKMQNVLIDDRRIHVDFSQSVARQWQRYKESGRFSAQQQQPKRRSAAQHPAAIAAALEQSVKLENTRAATAAPAAASRESAVRTDSRFSTGWDLSSSPQLRQEQQQQRGLKASHGKLCRESTTAEARGNSGEKKKSPHSFAEAAAAGSEKKSSFSGKESFSQQQQRAEQREFVETSGGRLAARFAARDVESRRSQQAAAAAVVASACAAAAAVETKPPFFSSKRRRRHSRRSSCSSESEEERLHKKRTFSAEKRHASRENVRKFVEHSYSRSSGTRYADTQPQRSTDSSESRSTKVRYEKRHLDRPNTYNSSSSSNSRSNRMTD